MAKILHSVELWQLLQNELHSEDAKWVLKRKFWIPMVIQRALTTWNCQTCWRYSIHSCKYVLHTSPCSVFWELELCDLHGRDPLFLLFLNLASAESSRRNWEEGQVRLTYFILLAFLLWHNWRLVYVFYARFHLL